jgi:hypothetical protein
MVDATNGASLAQATEQPSRGTQWTSVWYVAAVAGAIAIVVGAGAFYAGRQSAILDLSTVTAKWKEAEQKADAYASDRDAAKKELDKLKNSLAPVSVQDVDKIRKLTAQVNSYKNLVEGASMEKATNSRLAMVLSSPNARILPFTFVEPIAHAVVNLAMADGAKAAFVAANLPADHTYQLWFLKKDKDDITRGQSFTAAKDPTFLEFGAGTLTGVTQILVTEGAAANEDKPTSPAIMTLTLE